MKMVSVAIGGLGVLALLVGIVGRLLGLASIMGTSPGGFVRVATALYLLTLVVMVYGRWYAGTDATPPAPKA